MAEVEKVVETQATTASANFKTCVLALGVQQNLLDEHIAQLDKELGDISKLT